MIPCCKRAFTSKTAFEIDQIFFFEETSLKPKAFFSLFYFFPMYQIPEKRFYAIGKSFSENLWSVHISMPHGKTALSSYQCVCFFGANQTAWNMCVGLLEGAGGELVVCQVFNAPGVTAVLLHKYTLPDLLYGLHWLMVYLFAKWNISFICQIEYVNLPACQLGCIGYHFAGMCWLLAALLYLKKTFDYGYHFVFLCN